MSLRMPIDGGVLHFDRSTAGNSWGSYETPLALNEGGFAVIVRGHGRVTGSWTWNVGPISDLRLKKNVEGLTNVLEKIESLRGIRFEWRKEEFPKMALSEGKQIGIIAQEAEKEFPELVATDSDGYKGFAYDKFMAVLLAAIKELRVENRAPQERVAALEKSKQ